MKTYTLFHSFKLTLVLLILSLTLGVGSVWGVDYDLVTAVSQLAAGDIVVIATAAGQTATTTESTNSSKKACWFTYVNSTMNVDATKITSLGSGAAEYTLSKSGSNWIFTCSSGYIGSVSETKLRYGTGTNTWTITISSNNASIASTDAASRIIYFANNDRFRTYTSAQTAVRIYKKVSGPSITTSVSSLSDVGYSTDDFTQQVKSFTVSGSNLTENVTVTAPTNYEVCKTSGGTYTSSVTFDKGSGTLSASTVYVRLKSGKTAGSYGGNVECTSTGATTKNVAVSGSVPFTVTWKANGTTHATTYVAYATSPGTALGSLPDDPDPSDYTCTPKAFYGWYEGDYSDASTAPTCVTTATKITTDKTYKAVFANEEDGSVTSTFTASSQGWSDGNNATTKTISTVTYTWAQNSGSSAPKYYATGTAVRLYYPTSGTNGNQVTISSSNTITGIVFTYVEGYAFLTNAPSVGTLTTAGVWSGSATSITFKNKNNAQVRIQSIVVTYGSTTYSNYATTCCTPLGTINGSFLLAHWARC